MKYVYRHSRERRPLRNCGGMPEEIRLSSFPRKRESISFYIGPPGFLLPQEWSGGARLSRGYSKPSQSGNLFPSIPDALESCFRRNNREACAPTEVTQRAPFAGADRAVSLAEVSLRGERGVQLWLISPVRLEEVLGLGHFGVLAVVADSSHMVALYGHEVPGLQRLKEVLLVADLTLEDRCALGQTLG